MLRLFLPILMLFCAISTADAKDLQQMLMGVGGNSCWQRNYDAAELAAHPKQKVTSIVFSTEVAEDGGIVAYLGMNFRQRTNTGNFDYATVVYCKTGKQSRTCAPEWDAGSLVLEKGAREGLRIRNLKLVVNPSNYSSEDVSPEAVDMGKSDDGIWLLFPAKEEVCSAY